MFNHSGCLIFAVKFTIVTVKVSFENIVARQLRNVNTV